MSQHPIQHDEVWCRNPVSEYRVELGATSLQSVPAPNTASLPAAFSSRSINSPTSAFRSFEGKQKAKALLGLAVLTVVLVAVTLALILTVFKDSVLGSSSSSSSSASSTTVYPRGFTASANATAIFASLSSAGFSSRAAAALPSSLDWRTVTNVITPVKDQGQCGDCWAHSAIETMESNYMMKYSTASQQILSRQQLVDCDTVDGGCQGGNYMNAYQQYYGQNGAHPWAVTESTYPYQEMNPPANFAHGTCSLNDASGVMTVTSATAVMSLSGSWTSSAEQSVMTYLAQNGPLSIAVSAQGWDPYTSGVKTTSQLGCYEGCNQLDHAVQLVGYGTDNGQDYWLVRNSWNTWWGESGYIRLARGANTCGLLCQVVGVTVASTSPALNPTVLQAIATQTITFTVTAGTSDVEVGVFPTTTISPSSNSNKFAEVVIAGWSNSQWALRVGRGGTIVCQASDTLHPASGTGTYFVTVAQAPSVTTTISAGWVDSSGTSHTVLNACAWTADSRTLFYFAVSGYNQQNVYSNFQGVTLNSDPNNLYQSGTVTVPGGDYEGFGSSPVFQFADTQLNRVNAGYSILSGQQMMSSDGVTTFKLQTDGNLVVTQYGTTIWQTGIVGSNTRATLNSDCTFAVYNSGNKAVWSSTKPSSTSNCAGSYITVQTDGNVVVYTSTGQSVWSTGTSVPTPAPTTPTPTTPTPTTPTPTTATPTTATPTTATPTTATPTTATPTTATATTATASTASPTTQKATTQPPTTQAATTQKPTAAATTVAATTPAATTATPTTVSPTTAHPFPSGSQTITFAATAGASDVIVGLFPTSTISPASNGNVFAEVVIGGWGNTQWALRAGKGGYPIVCQTAETLHPANGAGSYYINVVQSPYATSTTIEAGWIDSTAGAFHPVLVNCVWTVDSRALVYFAVSGYGNQNVYSQFQGLTLYSDASKLVQTDGSVTVPAGDQENYAHSPIWQLLTPTVTTTVSPSAAATTHPAATTVSPTAAPTSIYVQSLGCFKDNSTRVLPQRLSNANNVLLKQCAQLAYGQKLTYFGLESGGECWAGGATYNRLGSSKACTQKCSGDSSGATVCGGYWAIAAYQIVKAASSSTITIPLSPTTTSRALQDPTCTYYEDGMPSFCWRCVDAVNPDIRCVDVTSSSTFIDLNSATSTFVYPGLCPTPQPNPAQICANINYVVQQP